MTRFVKNVRLPRVVWVSTLTVIAVAVVVACSFNTAQRAVAQKAYASSETSLLEQQLVQIGDAIYRQLIDFNQLDPEKAKSTTDKMLEALRKEISEPLTQRQLDDILSRYNTPTCSITTSVKPIDLQLELGILRSVHLITYYLKQTPMTADEKQVLNAQLKEMVDVMINAMETGLKGEPDESYIPDLIIRTKYNVYNKTKQPLHPMFKRPYTPEEFEQIKSMLKTDIANVIAKGKQAEHTTLTHITPRDYLICYIQNLSELRPDDFEKGIPSLSEDKMREMIAESNAISRAKGEAFDKLPDAEKERIMHEQDKRSKEIHRQMVKEAEELAKEIEGK